MIPELEEGKLRWIRFLTHQRLYQPLQIEWGLEIKHPHSLAVCDAIKTALMTRKAGKHEN